MFLYQVLEGRPQYLEMAGNLIPIMKYEGLPHVNFYSFAENRLSFPVRIRDLDSEPTARVSFLRDEKLPGSGSEPTASPICSLVITLPDFVPSDMSAPSGESHELTSESFIYVTASFKHF